MDMRKKSETVAPPDTYSLKDEVEADSKAAAKKSLITRITLSSFLLVTVSASAFAWTHSHNSDAAEESAPEVQGAYTETATTSPTPSQTQTPSSTPTAATASPPAQVQQAIPFKYSPAPIAINKSTFIADGNKVMANYSHIIELINFDASTSDAEKTARIKNAVALDSPSFSQVTSLRGQLVSANITDGPYMDATELAESGVSKISVGLIFMNYWADNHSRTSDLQSGVGGAAEGASILLKFSQKLNSL